MAAIFSSKKKTSEIYEYFFLIPLSLRSQLEVLANSEGFDAAIGTKT